MPFVLLALGQPQVKKYECTSSEMYWIYYKLLLQKKYSNQNCIIKADQIISNFKMTELQKMVFYSLFSFKNITLAGMVGAFYQKLWMNGKAPKPKTICLTPLLTMQRRTWTQFPADLVQADQWSWWCMFENVINPNLETGTKNKTRRIENIIGGRGEGQFNCGVIHQIQLSKSKNQMFNQY